MTTDVLVVGAGPSGLMLANQLGRRGIATVVIDRHSGPAQQSRAMAVHARTLEIYAKLGIADQAIALGRKGLGANMWTSGRLRARIPLEEMGQGLSAYPYVLMLGQDDNERIMGDRLRQWGLDVQWSTELVSLDQQPGRVIATVKDPDGSTRTITAAYVAGCDGSRSAVRELNGIGFPGAAYEHTFFVADTEAVGPMVPEELNVNLWGDGFHLYFPMRGANRWRVIGMMPPALRDKTDVTFADLVPSLQREAASGLSFTACDWFSTYRIHHRRTERFRDRRCLLVGDAAHVHSPMGGQGMNTGLQDAYNLAWKLALVVTERADEALLDTYEAERLAVADRLLHSTDRAFKFIVSSGRLAGLFRTRVMPRVVALAMSRKRVRTAAFRRLSQIDISYRRSRLSRTLAGIGGKAPQAGDRFPWLHLQFGANGPRADVFQTLDDTRFNLIVIGQPAPAAASLPLGDLLRLHVIPDTARNSAELRRRHIPSLAYYLLRPDGHIALAGTRFDVAELTRLLADCHIRLDAEAPRAAALLSRVG